MAYGGASDVGADVVSAAAGAAEMTGDISRSYKGPKDSRVPTWMEDCGSPTREQIAYVIRQKKQGFDIPQDLALEMADAILALPRF